MEINWYPVSGLALGILARIIVPWLRKKYEDPNLKWQWSEVVPLLISVAIVVLLLPLLINDLTRINDMPFQLAWVMGWGAAAIGHEGKNLIEARKQ